jgi:hypothetical protein
VITLALASFGRPAFAQQPTRLPAVVVNVAPDLPGARKIVGVVRDTTGFPIDSVEVSIVSLKRRVSSKADGMFRFDDVAPGTYEVRVRKFGYAPQVRSVVVDSLGATGAFAMVPLTQVLRPVVTSASRGGLSGVVGDTAFNALSGAEVTVLGHADHATTDSLGAFYMPIRPGSYIVRVERPGFDYRLVSVIVPTDSGQRVRVTLAPMSHPVSNRKAHNVDDFGDRVAWHSHSNSRIYTRAELETMRIEWVYDAVRKGYAEVHQGPVWIDADCSVIVNGGPEIQDLSALTVDDIESVEIYDVPSALPSARTPQGRGVPIPRPKAAASRVPLTNTYIADWANSTKKCTLVYVWLR